MDLWSGPLIEREIDDARSILNASASGKRKEDQPFSSSGKRQRTSIPRVSQGRAMAIRAKAKPGLLISQDR